MTPSIAQVEPPPAEPPFGFVASLLFAAAGVALLVYIAAVLYRESGELDSSDGDGAGSGERGEEE